MRIRCPLARRRNHRVRIDHPRRCRAPWRHRHSTVRIAAHRSTAKLAGRKARHASARSNPNLRWTRLRRHHTPFLYLDRIQFPAVVPRNRDRHARHVVANVKRFLALRRLHRAIAGSLQLHVSSLHRKAPAVSCAAACHFHQFLLNGVGRLRRHSRPASRIAILIASRRSNHHRHCEGEQHSSVHDGAIVNEPSIGFRDGKHINLL